MGDNTLNRMLFDYEETWMLLSPGPNLLSDISDIFSGERFRMHRSSPRWEAKQRQKEPSSFEHHHPLCGLLGP